MVENKIKLVQQSIEDGYYLFVYDNSNIFYLTGVKTVGSDNLFLLISKNKFFVFTSPLIYTQIKHFLNFSHKSVIPVKNLEKELAKKVPKNVVLKIDTEDVPFRIYKILSKTVKHVEFTNLVSKLRLVKDEDEIKNIKKGCEIVNKIIQKTIKYMRPGVAEVEIKNFILKTMAEYNVEPSFEPIVAFDENTSYPHHVSGNKKFAVDSLVLIDVGCKYNGYCCDITRMVNVSKIKNRQIINLYVKLKSLQKELVSFCKPGVKVKKIDLYARRFFEKLGYGKNCLHSVGHGLGIDIHELPRVSVKDNTVLQPGMVITIEPGVYFENKFGLRIEDDVVITDSGCRVLSL